MKRLGFVLALGLALGCNRSAVLRGRIAGLRQVTETATASGARVCAPRELALAETHLEFAEAELTQGDPTRAEQHLEIAEPAARAAERLSPRERCEHEPAPDTDRDGILDTDDACPTEPEDRDGVLDDDGCPEPDDLDGDGVLDSADLCPSEREDRDDMLDEDGCPEPDDDLDGVPDLDEACDREPEDHDGFEDSDGCPDRDNDGDGVLDTADTCPNVPGVAEEEGCPRTYANVELTDTHVVIREQVHFATNRAVIQSNSFALLDTIAQLLRDHPGVHLEIGGHTDDRGNDVFNLGLSARRAAAVVAYLVAHGVESSRLTSRGYGETTPIESNRTSQGRAANRRVELVRTDGARTAVSP